MSSAIRGVPDVVLTSTGSSNVTLTAIVAPTRYAPVAFGDETDATPGGAVSSSMPDVPASESAEPGAGSASRAALPASSAIAPPSRDSADSPSYPRRSVASPSETLYENSRLGVPEPDTYDA